MMIKIQATVSGYSGRACSLFSAYDQESKVLVIGAEGKYQEDRRDDCIVITNIAHISRDWLFREDDFMSSIKAFFALKAGVAADKQSARLAFTDRAVRANPDQAIEQDGIDASGPKYRVADGITSTQVAALATCLYAMRADSIERSVKMAESLQKVLASGQIITI